MCGCNSNTTFNSMNKSPKKKRQNNGVPIETFIENNNQSNLTKEEKLKLLKEKLKKLST